MNINTNVNDYLTPEEMKEIAIQEFKKLFANKVETERILYNFASRSANKFIENTLTEEDLKSLRKNVTKIIKEKDLGYHIFDKPNVWDTKKEYSDYIVYDEIQKVIAENIDLIREKVVKTLEDVEVKEKYEECFDPTVLLELMIKQLKGSKN